MWCKKELSRHRLIKISLLLLLIYALYLLFLTPFILHSVRDNNVAVLQSLRLCLIYSIPFGALFGLISIISIFIEAIKSKHYQTSAKKRKDYSKQTIFKSTCARVWKMCHCHQFLNTNSQARQANNTRGKSKNKPYSHEAIVRGRK